MLQESPKGEVISEHFSATSGEFNTRAKTETFDELKKRYLDLQKAMREAAAGLSLNEFNALVEENENTGALSKTLRMDRLDAHFDEKIGALCDPGAPSFGARFIAATREANCRTVISDKLSCSASYVSYVYQNDSPTFLNEIRVNPKHIRSVSAYINSKAHEYVHAFQKHAAPALHLSPSNANSRAVVHPLDWMRLELFCERNAFTMQAVINTILAKDDPEIREKSKFDVVTVSEFEAIREKFPRLEDAVVYTSRISLSKDYVKNESERSFADYYHNVALNNYRIGMNARRAHGDTDLVFVRLEDSDLWEVGNNGIIPNTFGEYFPEPLAFKQDRIRPEEQEILDKLCKDFNIPSYDTCPTMAEYEDSMKPSFSAHNATVVHESAFRHAPVRMPAHAFA